MSEIFAYAGSIAGAAHIVLEGLRRLQYGSYDSWGIGVPDGGELKLERHTGPVAAGRLTLPPTNVALGHARRATHGAVTLENAHPHLDCEKRIALTHNGVVANHQPLRQRLEAQGHTFRSDTDSEIIAHLIEESLKSCRTLVDATIRAFHQVEGENAIGVLDVQRGAIIAIKRGLPLALGWSRDGHLVASDAVSLVGDTRCIAFLTDDHAALIHPQGIVVYDSFGAETTPCVEVLDWDRPCPTRGPHGRLVAALVRDQSATIRTVARSDAPIEELARALAPAGPLILTGSGASYHAGLAGTYALSRVAGRLATCVRAAELPHLLRTRAGFDAPEGVRIRWGDGTPWLVAICPSGEAPEVLEAVRAARAQGMSVAALTQRPGSTLHRMADAAIAVHSGPLTADAWHGFFGAQVSALSLVAWTLIGRADEGRRSVERAVRASEAVASAHATTLAIARTIEHARALLVLGRGVAHPAALQAAQAVRKLGTDAAAGFDPEELAAGSAGLVGAHTPCLILAPQDEAFPSAVSAARQARSRGALTLGLSPCDHPSFDAHLPIADCGELSVLPLTVAAQLIASCLADLRAGGAGATRSG